MCACATISPNMWFAKQEMICAFIIIISMGKATAVQFPLLDNLKAPLVAELDTSKIKIYIDTALENMIFNVTQALLEQFQERIFQMQGRIDKGVKDALQEIYDKLDVTNTKLKEKPLNSTCSASYECTTNLICLSGNCQCVSSDLYWTGEICVSKKTLNATCSASYECATNLICLSGNCQCVSSDLYWTGEVCVSKPKECMDVTFNKDGIYTIYPNGKDPVKVYCIVDGNKKWTVIQRRMDGSVNFDRKWSEYKLGFGSINGEYWLGNDNIHLISSNGHHEISFYLGVSAQQFGYANYSTFSVGDERSKYKLTITGYSGNTSDSMDKTGNPDGVHNGQKFSTLDQDNDSASGNCTSGYHNGNGGWWYNNCYYAALNRRYSDGVYWYPYSERLVKSIMMIKQTS